MACAHQFAVRIENRSPNGNAALRQAFTGLCHCGFQHRRIIEYRHSEDYIQPRNTLGKSAPLMQKIDNTDASSRWKKLNQIANWGAKSFPLRELCRTIMVRSRPNPTAHFVRIGSILINATENN
jgi:hypothetical protein